MDEVLAILSQTADGVYAVDRAQRIVFWNAAAERLLGYGAAEVMEVSSELCNFFSHWHPLTEQDHELIECRLPIANRLRPLFGHLLQRQIHHLHE